MNRQTQGLLIALLGAVLLRLGLTDTYLRYVTEWMKWPLLVSGALLLLLGLSVIVVPERGSAEDHDDDRGAGHRVPLVTWLLVLPALMVFVVSPPELGSYLAERRAAETVAAPKPAAVADLKSPGTVPVDLIEFVWRAQEGGESIAGQSVSLEGFVSYGEDGEWFVTQLVMSCCAADATAYGVRVRGVERPQRDQWVRVTGVHVAGTGTAGSQPAIEASSVEKIRQPRQTYG